MAKPKEEGKTVLERIYNVPLRKQWLKAPLYSRAKKGINALKAFLKKHMKSTEIRIGGKLNKEMWKHGIKNPPHHVKITVIKDDQGVVKAELFGHKYEEKKKEVKKEPKTKLEEAKEKLLGKETVKKVEEEAKEAVEKEKHEEKKKEIKPKTTAKKK